MKGNIGKISFLIILCVLLIGVVSANDNISTTTDTIENTSSYTEDDNSYVQNSNYTDDNSYTDNIEDSVSNITKESKKNTSISVSSVKSVIDENMTLTATILSEDNESVDDGYVIFKLNGITIKDNGKLTGSTENLKVYVKNQTASTTVIADLNMRNAKTLTAVYSGSSTYNASRSNNASAQIALRNASLTVTTNKKTIKQGQYLTLTAKIYDITNGERSNEITSYEDEYVYFKVNGITLKNSDGKTLKTKVVNNTATTQYYIPLGLSGVTDGQSFTVKNHTVLAGYYNKNYYPTAKNTTTFQTERSNITINITNAVVNKTAHKLSVNATIKDYLGNYVIGPNKYIIKINGITVKKNDSSKYFYAENGVISLKNLEIPSYSSYKNIEIVTQDRLAYKSQRNTTNINITNMLTVTVSVKNVSVAFVNDTGKESAIIKNITTVDGKPDLSKLGSDYVYADEDGVYNITSEEILRVRRMDSYCQQIYGFAPKYTFFRAEDSNIKYIISREKWNVISRALSEYHVNKGYTAVNPPYKLTVNLTGKVRYLPIYFDYQEYINGQRYTCGPTAMSMISQALNVYRSERRLAGVYGTTAAYGTEESSIIKYSPSVNMKLTNIANTKESVKSALLNGSMIFWHIKGHYMAIAAYNYVNDTFLCLNPSGPSHNINATQWATWSEVTNTDKGLKDNGFMKVTPYYDLNSTMKEYVKNYYYNMGGKYTAPANSQMPDSNDNPTTITVDTPSQSMQINKSVQVSKIIIKTVFSSNYIGTENLTASIYLNGKLIDTPSINDEKTSTEYRMKISENMNLTVVYSDTTKSSNSEAVEIEFSPVNNSVYTKEIDIGSLD